MKVLNMISRLVIAICVVIVISGTVAFGERATTDQQAPQKIDVNFDTDANNEVDDSTLLPICSSAATILMWQE